MDLKSAITKFAEWELLRTAKNTIYGYDGHLRHFCIFLRNPDIENITIEQIIEYLALCQSMGFKGSTLEKYGQAIKNFIYFYKKQGYSVIDSSLIPIPKIYDRAMPRVLDDEDFEKLVRVIPKESNAYYHLRNLAIVNLLYDSGIRNGEMLSVNVEDIDVEKKEAIIRTEKSRSDYPFRKIFWNRKETTESLKRWFKKREELLDKIEIEERNALFISLNGGCCADGTTGRRMDQNAVAEMLRKYSKLAGLLYTINAHSFRHHLGRILAERGANNSAISDILGHKNLESSKIYTILSGLELGRIYHKVMGR